MSDVTPEEHHLAAEAFRTAHAILRAAATDDDAGVEHLTGTLRARGDVGELSNVLRALAVICGFVVQNGVHPRQRAEIWNGIAAIVAAMEAS
jgi:hypothetical protein